MTICAIMQPTYLPWLGYFALMDMVDIFVFLDDVQLSKQSWQTRNRIKREDGSELMLSVPIHHSGDMQERLIKDVEVNDGAHWATKHLKSFEQNYRRAPHLADAMAIFDPVLRSHGPKLCDLNVGLIEAVVERIGIGAKRRIRSSDVSGKSEDRRDRLMDLCKHVGAGTYLSPVGAAGYLGEGAAQFVARDIDLLYQSYEHPVYPQVNGAFLSHMGVLDLIANVGFDEAAAVIRSGVRPFVRTPETSAKEAV